MPFPPPQPFSRLGRQARSARGGIMGTSIERERGVMGWKKREKGNQRWRLEMSAIFSG